MKDTREDIKRHYEILTPKIYQTNPHNWVSPYGWVSDWPSLMSPIEFTTWQAIRSFGKTPMYPQYPVGKYFLDFGHPKIGVGIECDGKEFHKDKERDKKRDEDLRNEYGFNIYRVSGSDCYKAPSDDYYNVTFFDDERTKLEVLGEFYSNTMEGLLASIGFFYLFKMPFTKGINEAQLMLNCLNDRVSLPDTKHELNEFHLSELYRDE